MELLQKKNYLTLIQNVAKGENWMFRNVYARIDGAEVDITENGGLSCALLVSSLLYLHKRIGSVHATVNSTVKDMLASGWQETSVLEPGAVLVWERKTHDHIGFYIGDDQAVSNDSQGSGFPQVHHYTYNNTRVVRMMLIHPFLHD